MTRLHRQDRDFDRSMQKIIAQKEELDQAVAEGSLTPKGLQRATNHLGRKLGDLLARQDKQLRDHKGWPEDIQNTGKQNGR